MTNKKPWQNQMIKPAETVIDLINNNYSVTSFSKKAKISTNSVYKILNGDLVSRYTMVKISLNLDIPIDDIIQ